MRISPFLFFHVFATHTCVFKIYTCKLFRSFGVSRSRIYPGKLISLVLGFALLSLIGCSSEEELPPSINQPPTAELTSGPVEGGTVSYYVRISWTGSDPDGFITRYEYVVDPPAEFSETEIDEGGPGVESQFIPGTGGEPDVTRISKILNGKPVFFDWIHTNSISRRFQFSTPDEDTDESGPTGRFVGMHAFYVRAVDDDQAVSIPDKVAFTAETIAPESRISRPNISSGIVRVGFKIDLKWHGEDPDSPSADKTPVGFRYKLTKYDSVPVLPLDPYPPETHLDDDGPWIYQPAENLSVTLEIDDPGFYIFGVKAVDENGAVEPFLDWRRNVFVFEAYSDVHPTLTLSCEAGILTSKRAFTEFEIELPYDTDLNCSLSCLTETKTEVCVEFRWGFDPDIDGNWSDWTSNPVIPPFLFPNPGIYILYIQGRDDLYNTSGFILLATVIDFSFDREVLFVDDSFDSLYPRDEEQDLFWQTQFANYGGFNQVFEHHAHGFQDRAVLYPQNPTLEEMSRYQLIVWDCSGSGYDGITALLTTSAINRTLRSYLTAGGKLWVSGRLTVGATLTAGNGIQADLLYPKEELKPGEFPHDFFKLRTTSLNNDRGTQALNTLRKVNPSPGGSAGYEAMFVDPSKLNAVQAERGGVSHVDAIFDPLFSEPGPESRGDLDSLYVYGATGDVFLDPKKPSEYHGRLCALRWHDPDPDREHGRIQWFGFPMYYFFDDQAQDTFNKSMDWFREEEPPSAISGEEF